MFRFSSLKRRRADAVTEALIKDLDNISKQKIQELGQQWGRLGKWLIHRVREWGKQVGRANEQARQDKMVNIIKGVGVGGISNAGKLLQVTEEMLEQLITSKQLIEKFNNGLFSVDDKRQLFKYSEMFHKFQVPHVGGNEMANIYTETLDDPPVSNLDENVNQYMPHLANVFAEIDENASTLLHSNVNEEYVGLLINVYSSFVFYLTNI